MPISTPHNAFYLIMLTTLPHPADISILALPALSCKHLITIPTHHLRSKWITFGSKPSIVSITDSPSLRIRIYCRQHKIQYQRAYNQSNLKTHLHKPLTIPKSFDLLPFPSEKHHGFNMPLDGSFILHSEIKNKFFSGVNFAPSRDQGNFVVFEYYTYAIL